MSMLTHLPAPLAPPVLGLGLAVASAAWFTVSYVGSLYLSPAGRINGAVDADGVPLDRDHPVVIRSRIKTASAATALSLVCAGALLKRAIPPSGWLLDTLNIGRLLGLPLPVPTLLTSKIIPISPPLLSYIGSMSVHIAAPVLLTSLLYLGPLLTRFLDGQLPFQRQFNFHTDIVERFTSLAGVRNFLVGPATEELVFRASILAPLYFAGVTRAKLVLATPGFFGIAHVHHAYNVYVSGGRTRSAAIRGAITATAQFVYTTAFGWYANFLFLRAGSVPPDQVHT
ncbi:abi-domain-containing protein [Moesziomyces antarcticus]|uniref:intramembrane prenyl-peptidase Rce1 n=2 Tax=Pseudozyma antarctica TaxID=84753 RepID=A0A081CLM9_PSEA2|nr:abi-domain-containing protein [Moesziomyces antarcticus]GAK67575.1 abi-domain-containing protein [Moesziomyces antarcticus]SPO48840.1 related to CAAX prenyl protease 2 [Moesziomyces antarcticus]